MGGQETIAVVYTSNALKGEALQSKQKRLDELKKCGFDLFELPPINSSDNSYHAGTALERAAILSHVLTNRKYKTIWAARGGSGSTGLIPFLENMLPPVISDKTLVGFSDVSYIGNYLSKRFPNLTYVHAAHVFDTSLFTGLERDRKLLFSLLKNEVPTPVKHTAELFFNAEKIRHLDGECVPLNLSLAESLAATRHISLEEKNIIFIEDLNEDLYRVQRKMDSLRNSGLLKNTVAIVVGNFTDAKDGNDVLASEAEVTRIISRTVQIPVFYVPIFGHDKTRHPLVAGSRTKIENENGAFVVTLTFEKRKSEQVGTDFSALLERPHFSKNETCVHFTGVGGTGMAAVAGLFVGAGFKVTGSDGPIYPPMSQVIERLGIRPDVGYSGKNIEKHKPDFIVLSNVISRVGADLKPNPELEHILTQTTPVLSFPSALRKYFLHNAKNIVVTGTHGKTTTTSLIAQTLTDLGKAPSFFVGGSPKNFDDGFKLASPNLFILEGDEYDTAFFDKGPKFLHYEASVALLNNIEFDHADIYANVEAIEGEFMRLAKSTRDRGGLVVANLSDSRVAKIAKSVSERCIGFCEGQSPDSNFPVWKLLSFETKSEGCYVSLESPCGKKLLVTTQLFGKHNAMNVAACFASLHALHQLETGENNVPSIHILEGWAKAVSTFSGVRRRFELVSAHKDIAVFDDFAHHPTAIDTTLKAFRAYMQAAARKGRLIACFDPRNATMRRAVLQRELTQSFSDADVLLLGKVPVDQRIAEEDVLNGPAVAKACGEKAKYFSDNNDLCDELVKLAQPGDTVVFMSSGSFDNLPRKFSERLGGKI